MNETHRELARQTFVFATELLEEAHEEAIAGQSQNLVASEILGHAVKLRQLTDDIGLIAAFLCCLSKREIANMGDKSGI